MHQPESFDCQKTELEKYSCSSCHFSTYFLLDLYRHSKSAEKRSFSRIVFDPDEIHLFKKIYRNAEKCKTCPYWTKSVFLLMHHFKRHKLVKPFACTTAIEKFFCRKCFFSTYFVTTFKQHLQECHAERKKEKKLNWFHCQLCPCKFNRVSSLRRHMTCKHEYVAEIGESTFVRENMTRIIRAFAESCRKVSGDNWWFECTQCDFSTDTLQKFKIHLITTHIPANLVPYYYCDVCGFKSKQLANLKQHIYARHTPDEDIVWFQCEMCDYKCKRKPSLQTHRTSIHQFVEKKGEYCCEVCDFTTPLRPVLRTHILTHPTSCQSCEFQAETLKDLKKHKIRVHTDPTKWHRCDQCDYRTLNLRHLNLHTLTRHITSEIQWQHCPQCDYKSKRLDGLKRHMLNIHTPVDMIKWYECEMCHVQFKETGNLKQHMKRQHPYNGYKCEYCQFRSNLKLRLHQHLAKEHPFAKIEKMYGCDLCSYKTNKRRYLKQHMFNIHTPTEEIQWFNCDQCEYRCKTVYCLEGHVRSKHGGEGLERFKFLRRRRRRPKGPVVWQMCAFCEYKTKKERDLSEHIVRMHPLGEKV